MGCSCHINPPCSYCTNSLLCGSCDKVYHPDDCEFHDVGDELHCDYCFEMRAEKADKCECGGDKTQLPHLPWCPKGGIK